MVDESIKPNLQIETNLLFALPDPQNRNGCSMSSYTLVTPFLMNCMFYLEATQEYYFDQNEKNH